MPEYNMADALAKLEKREKTGRTTAIAAARYALEALEEGDYGKAVEYLEKASAEARVTRRAVLDIEKLKAHS